MATEPETDRDSNITYMDLSQDDLHVEGALGIE